MHRLVQLVGVPGVGKSRLISLVKERLGPEVKGIDFGSEFKQWMANRDYLPKTEIAPYLRRFIDERLFTREPAVVSSHLLFPKNSTFDYDKKIEIYMDSAIYALLLTDPAQIAARRRRDNKSNTRKRDIVDTDFIATHQTRTLETAYRLTRDMGSQLYVIRNNDGEIEEAFAILRRIIAQVKDRDPRHAYV